MKEEQLIRASLSLDQPKNGIQFEDAGGSDNRKGRYISLEDNYKSERGKKKKWKLPFLVPPDPGEPHQREWKGKPEHWCPKCKKWQHHNPTQHDT